MTPPPSPLPNSSPGRMTPLPGRAVAIHIPRALVMHPDATPGAIAAYASIAEALRVSSEPGHASNAAITRVSPWSRWESIEPYRRWLTENGFLLFVPGQGHRLTRYELYDEVAADLDRNLEALTAPASSEPYTAYLKLARTLLYEPRVRPTYLALYVAVYSVVNWRTSLSGPAPLSVVAARSHISDIRSFNAARDYLAAHGYLSWEEGTGHTPTLWKLTLPTPTFAQQEGVPGFHSPRNPRGVGLWGEWLVGEGSSSLSGFPGEVPGGDGGSGGDAESRPPSPTEPEPQTPSSFSTQRRSEPRAISKDPSLDHSSSQPEDDESSSNPPSFPDLVDAASASVVERLQGKFGELPAAVEGIIPTLVSRHGPELAFEAAGRLLAQLRDGQQVRRPLRYAEAVVSDLRSRLTQSDSSGGAFAEAITYLEALAKDPSSPPDPPTSLASALQAEPRLAELLAWLMSPSARSLDPDGRLSRVRAFAGGPPALQPCEHRIFATFDSDAGAVNVCSNPDCRFEWPADQATVPTSGE